MGTGGDTRKRSNKRIDWQTNAKGIYWSYYLSEVDYVGFNYPQDCSNLCH